MPLCRAKWKQMGAGQGEGLLSQPGQLHTNSRFAWFFCATHTEHGASLDILTSAPQNRRFIEIPAKLFFLIGLSQADPLNKLRCCRFCRMELLPPPADGGFFGVFFTIRRHPSASPALQTTGNNSDQFSSRSDSHLISPSELQGQGSRLLNKQSFHTLAPLLMGKKVLKLIRSKL